MKLFTTSIAAAVVVNGSLNSLLDYCSGPGILCHDFDFLTSEIAKSGIGQVVTISKRDQAEALDGTFLPVIQVRPTPHN